MVLYVGTALLGILAFLVGRGAGRRGRAAAFTGYGVVLALLLARGVLNRRPDWEFALFPWPGYVYVRSWSIYPLALACLGLTTALVPRGRNRNALHVLAAFVFVASLWTERWMAMEPDGSSAERATADHHCVQTESWSCGPAACVTLLSYLGVDATEGEMIRLCHAPPYGGTNLFHICRGLGEKLPDATVRIVAGDPDTLRARGGPAIVAVGRVHAVVVHFTGDEVVLHDPARPGPERMSFEEYRRDHGGFAVVVD